MNQKFKTREGYPPGVWEDQDGALHFSLPEIMEHVGVPLTKENTERMRRLCDELLRKEVPDANIVHQEKCLKLEYNREARSWGKWNERPAKDQRGKAH